MGRAGLMHFCRRFQLHMRKIVGKIHLWLGLASGLVVFIISVTGCLLAFEWELRSLFGKQWFHLPAGAKTAQTAPLPPSQLRAIAEKEIGKSAQGVIYGGKDYSSVVQFYGRGDNAYYQQVFMNPYNGQVLRTWDAKSDFFRIVLEGHFNLWLPRKIGQPIVAWSTLAFFVLLLSGLVLWWPRNKAARKQRFSVKWDAKWKRKNYDLHNVLGFYVMSIAVILIVTGLVYGFKWWADGLYYATTGGKSLKDAVYPISDTTRLTPAHSLEANTDIAWARVMKAKPAEAGLSLYFATGNSAPISVTINNRPGTYYKTENFLFDQYTLQPLEATGPFAGKYEEKSMGDKFRRMNYDLHVGAIWGLPGKLLMFFASLICASLPVTGVCIWLGRKRKAKKAKKAPLPKPVLQPQPALS